jgi:hypothetical protein
MTPVGFKRVRAGLYRHEATGRSIVQTEWDGPRGGKSLMWEHARDDEHSSGIVIDGWTRYPTLREAAADMVGEASRGS